MATSLALLSLQSCSRTDPPFRPAARALTGEELKASWDALAGDDFAGARRWMQTLSGSPKQSVPFLGKLLHPAEAPDPALVSRLIGALNDPKFAVREKAASDLSALGEGAVPALRKALADKPSLEVRRRAEQILAKIETAQAAERRRARRALEVLVGTGTPEARQLLQRLTRGAPGADLTTEAEAALRRLEKSP
jgi:hypothetical protein